MVGSVHTSSIGYLRQRFTERHFSLTQCNQEISINLSRTFRDIINFCHEDELIVNANKTQLIIFKVPGKKIANDYEVS